MSAYLDLSAIVVSIALIVIGLSWWSGRRIYADTERGQ
jgi:hypothetical protein